MRDELPEPVPHVVVVVVQQGGQLLHGERGAERVDGAQLKVNEQM